MQDKINKYCSDFIKRDFWFKFCRDPATLIEYFSYWLVAMVVGTQNIYIGFVCSVVFGVIVLTSYYRVDYEIHTPLLDRILRAIIIREQIFYIVDDDDMPRGTVGAVINYTFIFISDKYAGRDSVIKYFHKLNTSNWTHYKNVVAALLYIGLMFITVLSFEGNNVALVFGFNLVGFLTIKFMVSLLDDVVTTVFTIYAIRETEVSGILSLHEERKSNPYYKWYFVR